MRKRFLSFLLAACMLLALLPAEALAAEMDPVGEELLSPLTDDGEWEDQETPEEIFPEESLPDEDLSAEPLENQPEERFPDEEPLDGADEEQESSLDEDNSVELYASSTVKYPVTGGNLTFDLATGTVVDCDQSVTAAVIPAEIEGVAVTSIGEAAFSSCYRMTAVTIPEGVASIGERAFDNCQILPSIAIPDGIASIGAGAFNGCRKLTTITIPDSVVFMGAGLFNKCNELTEIVIPEGVTSLESRKDGSYDIYYGFFEECRKLQSVTLPSSLTSIGERCFYGCSSLTAAALPASLRSIGERAFYSCSELTEIDIPDGITSIGYQTFYGCGLTRVSLPDSVTSIGKSAFANCGRMASITIPDSVTFIGDSAFESCTSLDEFVIPEKVTAIRDATFYSCTNLASITIPDSVTSIGDHAFATCKSLASIEIPESVTSMGGGVFAICSALTEVTIPEGVTALDASTYNSGLGFFASCTQLESVNIPSSVTVIGDQAFDGCTKLTEINLPDGLLSIGKRAFWGCNGLTEITIPNTVDSVGAAAFAYCKYLSAIHLPERVTSMGGGVFYHCTALTSAALPAGSYGLEVFGACGFFAGCSQLSEVTLHEGLTSIGEDAFMSCKKLTSLSLPSSVTSIGKRAFYDCSGLSALAVPEGVASIGDQAFHQCSGMETILLPSRVDFMGKGVFYGCSSLTAVTLPEGVTALESIIIANVYGFFEGCGKLHTVSIPSSVTSIGEKAFYGCGILASVTLPDGLAEIGENAFGGCKSLPSISIPSGVTAIGSSAFSRCSGLTGQVTIPKGITVIENYTFNNCSGLTSILIPSGVTSIGEQAFYGCAGLTSLAIPESVSEIGKSAFSGCSGLTGSITVPKGITAIKDSTFQNCTGLTSISIPYGVTTIGKSAFSGCSGLTSFSIPYGVSSIGESAFYGCAGLTSLAIPESVSEIGKSAFSGCTGLTGSVAIPKEVTAIGDSTFENCAGLSSVTIPDGVTSIGASAFSGCSGLTRLALPRTVETIGSSAFSGCSGLTGTFTIPSGVTLIAYSLFKNCTGLTSISIPYGISAIGESAFYGCTSLTGSMVIPDGVMSIGSGAFYGCTGLTGTMMIPNGVTVIGDRAFVNCSGITSVEIPAGVTVLGPKSISGYGVFHGCSSLETVKIPDTMTYLNSRTFSGCENLANVYYSGNEDQWDQITDSKNAVSKDIVHFNSYAPPTPPTASLSVDKTYSIRLKDTKALAAVFSVKGTGGGVSGTVSWTSSDSSVFQLISPTSGNYRGLSTSFEIRGNGKAVGTSKVTITAGNLTQTFTVRVKEAAKSEISPIEDAEVEHREKNVETGSFFVTNDDDLPITITITSSNPSVFKLSSSTRVFTGSSYVIVKGDALAVGTSTIRVETSDGASTSFQVTVVEKSNKIVLSGPRELNSDGESAMDSAKKTGSVSAKITVGTNPPTSCTWTTSDPNIVSFQGGKAQVVQELETSGNTIEIKTSRNVVAVAPGKEKKATITCTLSDGTKKSWTIKVHSDAERKLKALAEAWVASYMQYNSALEALLKEATDTSIDPGILETMAKKLESKLMKDYGISLSGAEWNTDARVAACKALLELLSEQIVTQCALKDIAPDSSTLPANIVKAVVESMDSFSHTYQEQDENGVTSVSISRFDAFGATTGQVTYKYKGKDGQQTSETMSFTVSASKLEKVIQDFQKDLCDLGKAANLAALKTAMDEMSKAVFGKDIKNLSVKIINSKIAQYAPQFKELLLGNVPEMLIECCEYYSTAADYLMNGDFLEDRLSAILFNTRNVTFADSTIGSKNKALKQAVKAMDEARKDLNSALDEYLRTGKVSDKKKATGLMALFMCPVSVDIYKDGAKIGSINDEGTYCDNSDVAITQTAEVKTVYYSEPLTFQVVGTDYGTLNCTFEETVGGVVTQRTNYYDIPLYAGKEISAVTTTPVVEEDEITSGTVELSIGSESVAVSETITIGDYAQSFVQIDCPDVQGGSTMGADSYIVGDSVRMQAMANNGYSFLGWLDDSGALVCTTPVYEFTARENLTLTPVFAQDYIESSAVITVSGMTVQNGISTVTLNDPDGILMREPNAHIFAAVYADGRMEQVASGTLSGTTVVFSGNLGSEWDLFILDGSFAPLCSKAPLSAATGDVHG